MNKNVYVVEWYGPFSSPTEVIEWESKNIGDGKTYLYIIKGKKYAKRNFSYYCGQAYKQSSGKRITNKGHHINEVIDRPNHISIWVAKFQNIKPSKGDVNLVEKLITSVFSQAVVADEKCILNQTNKLRPRHLVYLINEWYYENGEPIYHTKKGSIPDMLHDVLICYPHEDSASIYGNRKIHYLNELK